MIQQLVLSLSDPETQSRAAGYLIQLAMEVMDGRVNELDIEARTEFLETTSLGSPTRQHLPGLLSYTVRSG